MSWWKRKGESVEHPVFGSMVRDRLGQWVGEIRFEPEKCEVQLCIDGPAEGVPEWAEECLRTLKSKYSTLAPGIQARFLELPRDLPVAVPWNTDSIADVLVMDQIHLQNAQSLTLGYGLTEEMRWPDLMLTVEIINWEVGSCWADD